MNEVATGEEAKLQSRDVDRIRKAVLWIEKLSRRVERWSSVKEIRRWRESFASGAYPSAPRFCAADDWGGSSG
ncbi:MAG: hypothetical protein QXM08_06620 [Thermofilaceae archaeon]